MFRWSHVLTLYTVMFLYYASCQVKIGSLPYYGIRALIGGVVAFLFVDLVGSYAVTRMEKLHDREGLD